MPKHQPAEPQWKKSLYVTLATLLGALSGVLAHGLVALFYVRSQVGGCTVPVHYNLVVPGVFSPFPPYLFWMCAAAGALAGVGMGIRWWQMIYVEHRTWKNWYR